MITIEAVQTRQRFGRIRKRTQWRWTIWAANHRKIDPRDTYSNPGDILAVLGRLVTGDDPVRWRVRYLDGRVREGMLR